MLLSFGWLIIASQKLDDYLLRFDIRFDSLFLQNIDEQILSLCIQKHGADEPWLKPADFSVSVLPSMVGHTCGIGLVFEHEAFSVVGRVDKKV